MLQTQALKYFMEVARTGSLRKASLTFFVAPSAISRQIANLEEILGTPLFVRSGRGMSLTPAGMLVQSFAQEHAGQIKHLRAQIEDLSQLGRGVVQLAVVEGATHDLIPRLISSFSLKHPNIEFEVAVVGTHAVAEQIASGQAELGVMFNTPGRDDLKLLARLPQPLQVVFRPGHRVSPYGSLRLEDLRDERLAVPDRSFGIRQLIEDAARNEGVHLNIQYVSNSLQLLKMLVHRSDMVTFLTSSTFVVEKNNGSLASVALDNPVSAHATLDLVCSHARPLTAAARAFLAHSKKEFSTR